MSTVTARVQMAAVALESRSPLKIRGSTALEGVRRNLFGCGDREESRRFAERELAKQLESDSQRWGFDFAREIPLPGAQRFAWKLVPATTIPAALRRAPMVPQPSMSKPVAAPASPESHKSQKRITDFLKPRKRLATPSGKKSSPMSTSVSSHHHHHHHNCTNYGTHIRPPKVARLAHAHLGRRS